MKRCIQADTVVHVMELLTGEKARSIEAAKRWIAHPSQIDPELLAKVIVDPGYKLWSKVISAYVLGFLPLQSTSKHQFVLRTALADAGRNVHLRAHAAEALSNLRDEGSTTLLKERLLDQGESKSVRRWSIYARGELGTSSALAALKRFASTQPRGALADELEFSGVALP